MRDKHIILTVGGSDPSGGAGLQADIKTADRLGLFPCSVVSAVTAQNTVNVSGIWPIERNEISAQLKSVLDDFSPDAVKIGLLPTVGAVEMVVEFLSEFHLPNVVVDPVVSLSLSKKEPDKSLIGVMAELLFPYATLVTPNIPEKEMIEEVTGKPFGELCDAFLLKGGHGNGNRCVDTLFFHEGADGEFNIPSTAFPTLNFNHSSLFRQDNVLRPHEAFSGNLLSKEFEHKRINTSNTHGSGCVLSTAIACFLAKGESLPKAVKQGISFLYESLQEAASFKISKGDYGPVLV